MSNGINHSEPRHPLARMAAAAAFLSFALAAGPAFAAGPHAARLSADLSQHLSAGSQNVEVIVDGAAAADRLAAKYNLTVKRRMRNGGVLVVNAGQLSAMQQDADIDHLSGNIRYKSSTIDPVDEGIGADQVWAGAGSLPKLTGRGVDHLHVSLLGLAEVAHANERLSEAVDRRERRAQVVRGKRDEPREGCVSLSQERADTNLSA